MIGLGSRKTHLWRGFVRPGALLATIACLPACEDLNQGPGEVPPTIALHGVTLRHYTAEGLSAIGQGEDVSFRRDSGRLGGEILQVDLPPSARVGRGGVRITARDGDGDVHGNDAHLGGGVRALSAEGDDARSEEATYDGPRDLLWADRPLHATGPGYVVDGRTWLAHVREHELALSGGSRAQAIEATP